MNKNAERTQHDIRIRITVLVVILAIATFGLLSGSLARFVEKKAGTDVSRVATFDFDVVDQNDIPLAGGDTAQINLFSTVETSMPGTGERLIAPGSAGGFEIRVSNKSDVPIQPIINLLETNAGGVPIVYCYEGKYYSSAELVNGRVGNRTITGNLTGMKADFASKAPTIAVGAPSVVFPVTWEWAFSTENPMGNERDTALGLRGTDQVILTVECTIEQVLA